MKIGLVAATIRNNRIDDQIKEIEYHLSNDYKCDLLCFGEAYLHGFDGMSWQYEIDINRAITIHSQAMKQIRRLAKKHDCGISFGYIEKFNYKIYSSNIVIDSNGDIVDNYRRVSEGWKTNLSDNRYSEGGSFQIFKLKDKKLVTAICGDLWWYHLVKEMEIVGENVDAVLWPLYIDYNPESWLSNAKQEYSDQVSSISSPILMINSHSTDDNEAKGGCCVFKQGHVETELPIGKKGVLIINI